MVLVRVRLLPTMRRAGATAAQICGSYDCIVPLPDRFQSNKKERLTVPAFKKRRVLGPASMTLWGALGLEAESQSDLTLPPRAKVIACVSHTAWPCDGVHAVGVLAGRTRGRIHDEQIVERCVLDLSLAAVEH